MMIKVPVEFQTTISIQYPPHNTIIFEEYFLNNFSESLINSDYVYLPIMWTSFYIKRNYGNGSIDDLQSYLNSLDRNKKYFTIVQYDDNILNDLEDLDIVIFSQGGYGANKEKSYPIPLNCISSSDLIDTENKKYMASFIGNISPYPIRNKLREVLQHNKDYFISEKISYPYFREIMSQSIFSLCPRGYGLTSFRICESLQQNSIPVYIFDEEFLPFRDDINFSDYGVLIHENEISRIDYILRSYSEGKIKELIENGKDIYSNYFSYENCYNKIIKKLNDGI